MKIIDNFLSTSDFEIVRDYLLSDSFTWNFSNTIANKRQGIDQYQFFHTFFDVANPSLQNYSTFLSPLLNKLQPKYLLRIKANLRPRTTQGVLSDYHVDMEANQQTAIFYINTNAKSVFSYFKFFSN